MQGKLGICRQENQVGPLLTPYSTKINSKQIKDVKITAKTIIKFLEENMGKSSQHWL